MRPDASRWKPRLLWGGGIVGSVILFFGSLFAWEDGRFAAITARGCGPIAPDTFLSPEFLTVAGREALVLGDGAFVLVHKESLDDGAQLVATAMSKDGQQRWSWPLGGTSVEASILAGSNVVIVLEAARGGFVIALSQKTGEVAWKYAT